VKLHIDLLDRSRSRAKRVTVDGTKTKSATRAASAAEAR
jgi:hypothetical protein